MNDIFGRVEALDVSLFETVPDQLAYWDRRALLGLHAAVAGAYGAFAYLEIGSYLGGSLQVLLRDPRCRIVISVDPRLGSVPDKRQPEWSYEDNTTEHMLQLLRGVDGGDMRKLVTLDVGSQDVSPDQLPARPDLCFIDGEHTDEAVMRDAELCIGAIDGEGVIAFHDYPIVQAGIREFIGTHWREISMALAFTGAVFAVEVGNRGTLRAPVVDRAIGSKWHSWAWRLANRWPNSPNALLRVWTAMPHIDRAIARGKHFLNR